MGCKPSKSGREATRKAEEKVGQRGVYLSFDSRVRTEWKAGDKNGDGFLSLKEVKRLLHKLNVKIPERELKKKFDEFDKDGNKQLDFDEFQVFFKTVQSTPNLEDIFKAAAAGEDVMVAEELQRFLLSSSSGKMNLSVFECAKLVMKYEGASEREIDALKDDPKDEDQFLNEPLLSYDGFLRLMTDSSTNSAMDHKKYGHVYQDMSHPLSHYYISSSHNTYLSGNQWNSESTPAAVTRALKLGTRVIELDAWDGPDGKPIVNHGHTMCKPASFQSCLDAIKENAFVASDYAVIITIENHCKLDQQKVQVEMLKNTFGSMLFEWDGIGKEDKKDWTKGPAEWLSPMELKGKIVIRDKPIKKKSKSKSKNAKQIADGEETPDLEPQVEDDEAPDNTLANPASGILSNSSLSIIEDEDEDEEEDEEDVEAAKTLGVNDELLRIMYIKNVKLKVVHDKSKKLVDYSEPAFRSSSSIVEGKMHKLTKIGYPMRDISTYAQRHLVRVYPAGSRVDSSNYDPTSAWNAGCQIVALNYQTNSMPVWLNQGKFSDNGGCGYILKPEFMLPTAKEPWSGLRADVQFTLTINVMSGHYLPKPLGKSARSEVIDPYVEISIHGMEIDQRKVSTKFISDNGFNPEWNESFSFDIHEPDLALLSVVVNDHDLVGKDDFIGQRIIPVSALVPGHKMVQLHFNNGAPMDSYLFVHIQFDPSPP